MKNLLHLLLLVLLFSACGSDDDSVKEIVLDKSTPSSQTIYSDETSAKEGISFTATENWVAVVNDISTRAEGRVDWLELSQYNGGPGTYTISIKIAKNDTGSDRKAEIKIVCGGTTITIVVEQKSVTSEEAGKDPGVDPEKPQAKKKVKSIKMYSEPENNMAGVKDMYLDEQLDFSYDAEGRIIKSDITDYWFNPMPNGGGEWNKDNENCFFTYKKQDNGNLVIEVESKYSDESHSDMEYLYCDNTGKVVSAKEVNSDKEVPYEYKYQYVYDEQNQLIQTERKAVDSYGAEPYTTDFTWTSNNIAAYKSTFSLLGAGNITYSDIKNDGNIDLAYILCFCNSTEMLAFPHGIERGSITGCFGKRVANMPAVIKGYSQDSEENYTFEYKLDADGSIVEVNIKESYNSSSYTSKLVIEYME